MSEKLEDQALRETAEEAEPTGKALAQTREEAIVSMRLAGASFEAIARVQELTSATVARRTFEAAIAATLDSDSDIPKARKLTGMRLERLLQSVWNKAINPKNPEQLAYMRAALSVIDRHAKLYGLDAPQKMEVYTPNQEDKEAWIRGMIEQVGQDGVAQEADIIEAEIVGDDE